ncbi:MAG: DUF3857 domain-containing protein [Planctomycetota bacterium]|jgi:hypothetical protein
MRKITFITALSLLLFLNSLCAQNLTELKQSSLWQRVLQNDFKISEGKLPQNDEDLYAVFCAAKVRADYEKAFTVILELLKRKSRSIESMSCFRQAVRLSRNLNKSVKLAEFLTILLKDKNLYPDLKNAVTKELVSLAVEMRDLTKVKKLIKTDSSIRLWALVSGPFRSKKPMRLDRSEIIEFKPAEKSYIDDLGRKVPVLHDVTTDFHGLLNLSDIIYSRIPGSVYTCAFLKSESEGEAVFSVINSSALKIWLNTLPVYRPLKSGDYRPSRRLLKVKLQKGINVLLIKASLRHPFAIQVLNTDFSKSKSVKAVSWNEGQKSLRPVKNIYGFINSIILPEPELLYYSSLAQPLQISQYLMMLNAKEFASEIQAARKSRKKLSALFPQSQLVKEENLLFYYRESFFGIDSRERLQKESFSIAKEITEGGAASPRAHFMQAMYLKDHNELEEALKIIRQVSKKAASWAIAYTEQALLEKDLGLLFQAEKSLQKAVELGSSQALSHLGNLLYQQKRYAESFSYYKAAYEKFSLNTALYLNKAVSAADWRLVESLLTKQEKFITGNDRQFQLRKAGIFKTRGELGQALKVYTSLEEKYGEDSSPCIRKAEILLSQGRKEEALKSFRQAQQRNIRAGSADLKLRKRIRSLTGSTWLNEKYTVSFDNAPAEKYNKENYPAASHAVLFKVVVCRVFPDYSNEKLIHSAVKVITKSGINKLGELKLPHDPDDLLMCRTILPDGTVFTPTNIRKLDFQKAASMYNVVPGAVLEYSYRSISAGGLRTSFSDNFFFEEFYNPAALKRYVLIVPQQLQEKVSAEILPKDFAPEIKKEEGNIIYTWEKKDISGIKPEPSMPSIEKVLSNLKLHVRNKKYPADHVFFKLPEKQQSDEIISAKAKALTADSKDNYEKVKTIHHYIRSSLTPAKGGRTARDAFYLKSGNEKSAMRLMQAMLSAVNVEHEKAAVNKHYETSSSDSDKRGNLAGYFYTPVLFVKTEKDKNIWLRFFSNSSMPFRHFRPGNLGQGVFNAPAITFDSNGFISFHRVYEKISEKRPVIYDTEFALNNDGSSAVSGRICFAGAAAGQLRSIADLPQQGKRRIERFITMSYPKLVLEKSEYKKSAQNYSGLQNAETEDFIFAFAGRINEFCRKEQQKLACNVFPYKFQVFRYLLAKKERKMDFNLSADFEVEQKGVYTAPEGWVFTEVPQSIWWQSDFGLYAANFNVKGRVLKVSRFLLLPARRIKAHNYRYFAEFIEECRKTEKYSVTLEKLDSDHLTEVQENRFGKAVDLNRFNPQYPLEQKK